MKTMLGRIYAVLIYTLFLAAGIYANLLFLSGTINVLVFVVIILIIIAGYLFVTFDKICD